MAEDLFNGVLGSDEEQAEAAAPAETPAGAEAFAAAIAAIASRQDPGVARRTEAFLAQQTELLDLQAQHLRDEHASRLLHLRLTVSAAKRKRYADHMRNGLYTCIALLVLGLLIGAIRMTAEAMRDHGLVVENFTVPPDLAARGATGEGLAEDLASRVAAIRSSSNQRSLGVSGEVRIDQSTALKVQIPETGISLDELQRFLHRWLGHQTVVNGEVRDEADGQIAILLHIAGADPIEVRGPGGELSQLMQTTAERAFAVFDPSNYVIDLNGTGRTAEALAAAQRNVQSSATLPPLLRADAYSLLSDVDPDRRRALSEAQIAIDIDPRSLFAWRTAAEASADLGHDQNAVVFRRRMLSVKLSDVPSNNRDSYPYIMAQGRVAIDFATGDFSSLSRDEEVMLASRASPQTRRYAARARVAATLHDEARSRQDLARALVAGAPGQGVPEARWYVASSAGDWTEALSAAQALTRDLEAQERSQPAAAQATELALQTVYRPWVAYAEAMTGDTGSATTLISQTPTDCYLCVRMRAQIAAVAEDAANADRWFAEAVRQAPDLPVAYYEWGEALLARGDLAGAARELSLAHDKGPHFADALKAWGDVLVKQGHFKQALEKYDEALKYAPSWGALKQARDAAANKRA